MFVTQAWRFWQWIPIQIENENCQSQVKKSKWVSICREKINRSNKRCDMSRPVQKYWRNFQDSANLSRNNCQDHRYQEYRKNHCFDNVDRYRTFGESRSWPIPNFFFRPPIFVNAFLVTNYFKFWQNSN